MTSRGGVKRCNASKTHQKIDTGGDDDEEEVFEDSELDSAADETPAIGGDDFMHTDDFRRLIVGFVMVDTLVAMRWLDKNGTLWLRRS